MIPAATSLASAALLALQDRPEPVMGTGSWAFMGIAWLVVTSLLVWSFVKVLTGGPSGDAS